ncbi:Insulin-like growth factor binding protein, N-terminal [Pseudocohnilembus persalinus]|uniref:Insulin-like growth factor binding protein, N-terminal n=1 Tax=Pseudocohnilembus persalinus TaxID=266149 RepID=A0A0V0R102_PSEPJ|nr:Insulin-like growth factor binding protein, N-terminal [Pseudocohnilembus persalinus]|eukprot:KRX07832.1 Insulin-like growth factor binding protein, N-terminal [Pseudocohnilembus persalinus]
MANFQEIRDFNYKYEIKQQISNQVQFQSYFILNTWQQYEEFKSLLQMQKKESILYFLELRLLVKEEISLQNQIIESMSKENIENTKMYFKINQKNYGSEKICECQENEYFNTDSKKCVQCDKNCKLCNQQECIECEDGFQIKNINQLRNMCLCKMGTYYDKISNTCKYCQQENCLECETSQKCKKCEAIVNQNGDLDWDWCNIDQNENQQQNLKQNDQISILNAGQSEQNNHDKRNGLLINILLLLSIFFQQYGLDILCKKFMEKQNYE